jgi:ADP-heptose:LPS heptosyltransferase
VRRLRVPPLLFSLRLPTLLAIFWRRRVARPRISGSPRKGPVSFLVFRLDAMGDVVLTTPLFRALKTAHPRSRCTVVVQKSYKSLLATNPHIHEILTLPDVRPAWLPRGMRRLFSALLFYWTALRKRHFDYAISPRWDVDEHLATLLCVLSHATTRVGYSERTTPDKQRMNRGFDPAWDICLAAGLVRHEVLRNLAAAEVLGAKEWDSRLQIYVTERDRRRADQLLAQVSPQDGRTLRQARGAFRATDPANNTRLVALGIGAQSPGRRWPLQRYAEVITQLHRAQPVRPVIVCSEAELGDALKLAAMLPQKPVIVSGAPLRQVCAVLERCAMFIGNDSGCAHLAAAMECRTLVISRHPRDGAPNHFNSPLRFAPHGQQVRVLQPAAGHDGCTDECVSPKPHCILAVSVDEVVAAARKWLNAAQPDGLALWPAKHRPPISPTLLQSHSADALRAAIQALEPAGFTPLA